MIEWTSGDIFASGADYLVNPVNCVGVSGKGLALAFKKAFPAQQKEYEGFAKKGMMMPGLLLVRRPVIFFPTKRHWKDNSRLENIDGGLRALREWADTVLERRPEPGSLSIAVPALGCGLGGLQWKAVRSEIIIHLDTSPVRYLVYEPQQAKDLANDRANDRFLAKFRGK